MRLDLFRNSSLRIAAVTKTGKYFISAVNVRFAREWTLVVMKVMNYTGFMTTTTFRPLQARNRMRPALKVQPQAPVAAPLTAQSTPTATKVGPTFTSKRQFTRMRGRTVLVDKAAVGPAGKVSGGALAKTVALAGGPVDVLISRTYDMPAIRVYGRVRGGGKERLAVISTESLRELVNIEVREKVAQEVARVLDSLAPLQSAAMSSARERGAAYARQQYDDPMNLSLADAAKHSGHSDRLINSRRNAGQYYALVLDGNSRGFRYPSWQFDARPERLAAVLKVLQAADARCWSVHHFMQSPSDRLEGVCPREWILDGARDIDAVVRLAQARFHSDQGAG